MRQGDRGAGGPSVGFAGGALSVGAGAAPAGGADVWLARYDPHIVEAAIKRGENAGRTLPHRDVVQEMILLGHWNGQAAAFPLPDAREQSFAEAAIVQVAGSGPILAATRR